MSKRVAGAKLIGRGGGGDAACDSSEAGIAVNADRVRRGRGYTACRRWRVDLVEKVAGTGLGLQRVQQRCSSGLVGGRSVWRSLANMCEGARRAMASPLCASRKPRGPRRAGPTLASESKTFRNRREKLSVRTERQVVVVAAAEGEEEEDAVRTVTLLDKRSQKFSRFATRRRDFGANCLGRKAPAGHAQALALALAHPNCTDSPFNGGYCDLALAVLVAGQSGGSRIKRRVRPTNLCGGAAHRRRCRGAFLGGCSARSKISRPSFAEAFEC